MFALVHTACSRMVAALGVAALLMSVVSPVRAFDLAALTESLPPLNYEQDGKVVGFSSELLDLMAREADVTVHKQVLPWSRAYDMVGRQGNTLIYSLARTPEREALFQWVGPISERRILLYRHRDRPDIALKTLDDARPYRIGVARDSASAKALIKLGFSINGLQDTLGPGLDLGTNDELNMKKFMARRFDLLVSLDWAAAFNAKNAGLSPDDLQPVWVLDDSLSYWYGVNMATDPDVAKRLNAALQRLKADGRYLQLKQKYLPRVTR